MADTHDTTDGLLAEYRGYAAGMPPSYHVTMSWHDFRRMLDRFEAAHRRETVEVSTRAATFAINKTNEEWHQKPGDAEELRKALVAIKALTEPHAHEHSELGTVYRTAKAFLKGVGDGD